MLPAGSFSPSWPWKVPQPGLCNPTPHTTLGLLRLPLLAGPGRGCGAHTRRPRAHSRWGSLRVGCGLLRVPFLAQETRQGPPRVVLSCTEGLMQPIGCWGAAGHQSSLLGVGFPPAGPECLGTAFLAGVWGHVTEVSKKRE